MQEKKNYRAVICQIPWSRLNMNLILCRKKKRHSICPVLTWAMLKSKFFFRSMEFLLIPWIFSVGKQAQDEFPWGVVGLGWDWLFPEGLKNRNVFPLKIRFLWGSPHSPLHWIQKLELQNCRELPLLCCTFTSDQTPDPHNSQANGLSLGNLFSILSQNDEIFHGSVSYSNMGSITSVWSYIELINWFCHEVVWNYISFQSLLLFSVKQWFI